MHTEKFQDNIQKIRDTVIIAARPLRSRLPPPTSARLTTPRPTLCPLIRPRSFGPQWEAHLRRVPLLLLHLRLLQHLWRQGKGAIINDVTQFGGEDKYFCETVFEVVNQPAIVV